MARKARRSGSSRLAQGDIIRDVQQIEYAAERSGELFISTLAFPAVIVLTQDCDLEQDNSVRWPRVGANASNDKLLLSVLVAPLYNVEHVYTGTHLDAIGRTAQPINRNRSPGSNLRNNETPRYHYLDLGEQVPIPPSVIDFKHYFSVNVEQLRRHKPSAFVCQLSSLYREDVSQRFAAYLSRIGLP